MSGFAQIQVIGNVGKDPEIRTLQNGAAVASFSLAYSERWGSGDDRKERTTWFRVEAWSNKGAGDGLVKVIGEYVRKGGQVMVVGAPTLEEYEQEGVKKQSFKIKLAGPSATLRLLGSPNGKPNGALPVEKAGAKAPPQDRPEDDIPF